MILAGDIGGTKTNLALFFEKEEGSTYSHLATYPSKNYPNLISIVQEFVSAPEIAQKGCAVKNACFAIAGPVVNGMCRATNLPWVVEAKNLKEKLKLEHVYLINDLEANAWAIDILSPENLFELYPGKGTPWGNRAVVSPGTGLGEAGIYWDGEKYCPFACEGGHCEFGPRDEIQIDLCRYLYRKYGHCSYERILSGPGLYNIYQFYKEVVHRTEPSWLSDELKANDPAKVITANALNHKSDLCVDSLNLFVSILGSEAGNCALKFMATGGVYLGGGIPPKILPKLKDSTFFNNFVDKGRLKDLLEEIPVHVILDDKASLKGAAHYCRRKLELAVV